MLVSRPQLNCRDSQSLIVYNKNVQVRVLLKLKQETISTRAGSETRRELRVYKNTFKIFSIDVFIFYQSLRLFPYFRVLSHFKTLALIYLFLVNYIGGLRIDYIAVWYQCDL